MKKFISIFLFHFILLAFVSVCFGATITVDDSGGKDYTSICTAIAAASAGDTIDIYDGIYREACTISASTQSWDNLTIEAASGETAVYWQNDDATYAGTGGSRWQLANCAGTNDCYRTTAADWSGGYMWGIFYEDTGTEEAWRLKGETSAADVDSADEFYHDYTNGYVYVRLTNRNGKGLDPDAYSMHMNNALSSSATFHIYENGTRDINGITIDGINFRFTVLGKSDVNAKGTIYADEPYPTGSAAYNVKNLTIQNCTFTYTGHMAIALRGTPGDSSYGGPEDTLITNSTFNDTGGFNPRGLGGGDPTWETIDVGYGAGDTIIQDSTFDNVVRYHIAVLGGETGQTQVQKSLTIRRCILKGGNSYLKTWNIPGEAISAGIRHLRDVDLYVYDTIITGFGDHGIWTQYADPNPDIVVIQGNTIAYNCQLNSSNCQGIRINNQIDSTLDIRNNIIWGHRRGRTTTTALHEMMIGQGVAPSTTIDYNLWDTEDPTGSNNEFIRNYTSGWSQWQAAGYDAHGIEEAYDTDNNYPDFVNNQSNGSGDYHIQSDSPSIGQAIASLGSGTDIDGDTRDASTPDIGGDEYAVHDYYLSPGSLSLSPGGGGSFSIGVGN